MDLLMGTSLPPPDEARVFPSWLIRSLLKLSFGCGHDRTGKARLLHGLHAPLQP
uniref:Uncharacterized protein n=1 Tax=Arundo donax TaxID=35708 RepID=A0A0A8YIU2_ARUDO